MNVEDNHILLVEQDHGEASTLQTILITAGFRVSIAAGGTQALEMLLASSEASSGRSQSVHAVVTALGMEGMSGQTLLQRVRADERLRHIPVLLIASVADEDVMIDCIEQGAVDYLLRPVREVLLLARLRASLERKHMGDRERDYHRLVELERRRAEMLLYDLLPAEIAARMKHGEQVIADSHEAVTVLFADLVGFTGYADGRAPAEVVRTLDTIFSRFDELATSYSVEKIKTIGDGYMAAAGLPTAREDHAEAAADLALAMRQVVRETVAEDGTRFSMRIGLASGPVIAGVIGQRRHTYDLWGDTVNVASRMESTAPGDSIQMTSHTAALLANRFLIQDRGITEIKGKMALNTSLLQGRKRDRRSAKRATFARTARFEVRRALELAERVMHEMHLVDAESGLLSSRGFLPMAETQWRRAAREGRTILVLVARAPADEELSTQDAKLVARLLRGTFRDTDLLVRWNKQTFAMMGMERSPTPPHVLGDRLRERAATFTGKQPPALALTVQRLEPAKGENEHRLLAVLTDTTTDIDS